MKTYLAIAFIAMLCTSCGGKSTSSEFSDNKSGSAPSISIPWSGGSFSDIWSDTSLDELWSSIPPIKTACRDANWTLDAITGLPPGFDKIGSRATVYKYSNSTVVESTSIPDHGSPYFPYWDSRYEPPLSYYFSRNGNSIGYHHFTYFLPIQPTCAETPSGLGSGIVGVALNGVALYSQYADSGNKSLAGETASVDQYNGHPDARNIYHYHRQPYWLTFGNESGLIGWALDGFPIYGPKNPDGSMPVLDDCNGQFSATAEFPDGIYHYHVTSTPPYLVGCFAGKAGTVSQ